MVEHTQVGSFFVSDQLLHGNLEIIQKIMGEVIIVSCIHNYGYGRFEYIAYSSHFRNVPRNGSAAPHYAFLFEDDDSITFEEVSPDGSLI